MPYCPNCGTAVGEGDDFCSDCGTSLGGTPRPAADEGPTRRRAGERASGARDRRGTGADRRTRRSNREGGRRNSAGSTSSGGTGRRDLLKYGGGALGVAALAGGGWFAFQQFSGGSSTPDTPKAVVRTFFRRVKNGNRAGANALIHPDSPLGKMSQSQIEQAKESQATIQSLEVLERSGDTARVEATMRVSTGGQSTTTTSTVVLRKHDGAWKLWE